VLGNETDGVSGATDALADTRLAIPMRNGVESLNVAVTASLIAFAGALGERYLDR
jgi:23S rRNA (guanosine2251-2'-O)-methyltransferase